MLELTAQLCAENVERSRGGERGWYLLCPFTGGELRPGNGTICCQSKKEVMAGSRKQPSSSPFETETPFLTNIFDDKLNT